MPIRYVTLDREPVTVSTGKSMYEKCECGKDRIIEIGEHVKLETLTLEEVLSRVKDKPCCS